jgi:hypothetical protein
MESFSMESFTILFDPTGIFQNSALKPKNQNIARGTNVQLGQLAQCFDLPTNCRPPSLPIGGLLSKQQHKTRQETVTLRGCSN